MVMLLCFIPFSLRWLRELLLSSFHVVVSVHVVIFFSSGFPFHVSHLHLFASSPDVDEGEIGRNMNDGNVCGIASLLMMMMSFPYYIGSFSLYHIKRIINIFPYHIFNGKVRVNSLRSFWHINITAKTKLFPSHIMSLRRGGDWVWVS